MAMVLPKKHFLATGLLINWHTKPDHEKAKQTLNRQIKTLAFDCGLLRPGNSYRNYLQNYNSITMITSLLIAAGIACFALFFASIDYFEKF